MEEEVKVANVTPVDVSSTITTPTSSSVGQALSTRRTSLKGRALDLLVGLNLTFLLYPVYNGLTIYAYLKF